MRKSYTIFAATIFIAAPMFAQSTSSEESERRLTSVTVTTLPPYMGTLHASPYVIRPQNFSRPGVQTIDFTFSPVEPESEGRVVPEIGGRQTYTFTLDLPSRPPGEAFEDVRRDYETREVNLHSGKYILSEVTYNYAQGTRRSPDVYCLSDGTFAFDIQGRDTLFLGPIGVTYPDDGGADISPLSTIKPSPSAFKGWRWTTSDLLSFEPEYVTFQESADICSENSRNVSAW